MKKNLFLRLCLRLVVALTIYSCRTDHLPEQEKYNNSSYFQLTSKTISLNQSKHKTMLVTELEKAKTEFKIYTKKQEYGKSVNFGDDIIIDTENVIYIENGSNYYTYTFNIKREGAPEDAPLENLVLSPLTDGTYKEFIVSYNLTPQEKQTIMSGGFLDTKDKSTITELGIGVYPGLLSKEQNCYWEPITIDIPCASPDQHMPGQTCNMTGTNGPQKMTVFVFICKGGDPVGGGWEYGGSGSNGNGGGASGNENPYEGNYNEAPCSPNGVLTGPQIPNDNSGTGLCGGGVPTLPNLPDPEDDPCEKIKVQRADMEFSDRITDLKGKTGLKKEAGYIQRTNDEYTYKDNASATDYANELKLPKADEPENKDIKGYMHTHVKDFTYDDPNGTGTITKQGFNIFSPADINYFMKMIKNAQDAGRPLKDVYAVMVSSIGNYQLRFTGNEYQINIFTPAQMITISKLFKEFMNRNGIRKPKDLEFGMLKYMQEKMNLKGISLYRMNSDGTNTEIKLNIDKTDREEINCSN